MTRSISALLVGPCHGLLPLLVALLALAAVAFALTAFVLQAGHAAELGDGLRLAPFRWGPGRAPLG